MMQRIIFIVGLMLIQSCGKQSGNWVTINNDDGVLILEGADSILFYQRAPKSLDGKFQRSNYIHPLYGVSGNVLTEDFPEDHYHHRGVFWAWHQVYIGDKRMGDAWLLEDFEWDVNELISTKYQDSCVLRTTAYWKSPSWLDDSGKQIPFAKERVSIKAHSSHGDYRIIDFVIEINALEDSISIGGSEDEKGYGGFSWRMGLPDDVQFEGPGGKVEPQNLALKAGPWMNISGSISGDGSKEGIVVISHLLNPNHAQPWILRKKKSMQNVVFPGRYKVPIMKNVPLVLKYRMIVYKDSLDRDLISELQIY